MKGNIPASQLICRDAKFSQKIFEEIQKFDGEGVILRKPRSLYTRGRSEDLLKIKVGSDGIKMNMETK